VVDLSASESACSGIPYTNSTSWNVTSTPTDVNPDSNENKTN